MKKEDVKKLLDKQTTYSSEEGFLVAEESAKESALSMVLSLTTTIEPYFDTTLDNGVDIYYDTNNNELQIHCPPLGSSNFYCFTNINGKRKLTRNPSHEELVEFLMLL